MGLAGSPVTLPAYVTTSLGRNHDGLPRVALPTVPAEFVLVTDSGTLPLSINLCPGLFSPPGAVKLDIGQIIQLAGTGTPPPVLSLVSTVTSVVRVSPAALLSFTREGDEEKEDQSQPPSNLGP